MRLALFQPDIPENTGAVLRLGACFGIGVDIIEPCGFVMDDRRLRRVGMDYISLVQFTRHRSWQAYLENRTPGRLVLLTTQSSLRLTDFAFEPGDTLLFGRESAGAPAEIHDRADARIRIPLRKGVRSLNLATAVAITAAEALRQVGGFPEDGE